MLNQVADGVWVRQSEWVWSNAIAVRGEGGLILVDPGIDGSELNQLADDLDGLGLPVAFECLAFVVGEVELFEHLLDSALDLEELSFGGVLGEVEGAAGAGEAVGALGEEAVAACSAYRFQEWPAGAGPSRLALPRCPARLA